MKKLFKVNVYGPDLNVIHLTFKKQHQMCLTLLRLQEFYECSSSNFKNKVFDLSDFIEWEIEQKGNFDYLDMTLGMNVPGNIVRKFFELYTEDKLSKKELLVKRTLEDYISDENRKFYLIASYESCTDKSILDHEIAHALYYIDSKYKKKQLALVKKLTGNTRSKITDLFLDLRYSNSVIDDEIHAYIATWSISVLIECFKNKASSSIITEIRENFVLTRDLFLKDNA